MMSWFGVKLPALKLVRLRVSEMAGGQPAPVILVERASTPVESTAMTCEPSKRLLMSSGVVGAATASTSELSQVARTVMADAAPPARYSKAPEDRKLTSFATAGSAIVCSESTGENTYSVVPATRKALKPSELKSARVTPTMLERLCTVPPAVLKMRSVLVGEL